MDRSSGCRFCVDIKIKTNIYYCIRVPLEIQSQAFRLQVELAMKLKLPLVLHIREAEQAGLAVLKKVGLPRDWPVHR